MNNSSTVLENLYVSDNESDELTHEDLVRLNPIRDALYVVIPLTLLYSIIFITGIVGNVITCVVIHKNKNMHTATNYYLFSLAVSDLLLLISGLPQEIYKLWYKWPYPFNKGVCILLSFSSETSANATVLTITAFTVERYVAICKPFLSHTMSKLSRAVKFVVGIWIVAICLSVPQVIDLGINTSFQLCMPNKNVKEYKLIFTLSTVLVFILPMTIITILYILIALQLRRSVVKRGACSTSSVRLKHKVLKNPSAGGNKAIVIVNTNLECHSDSILTYPKTQKQNLNAHHHQKQPLIRHPSLNSNQNGIDQQLAGSPEGGRINFSKKPQNHGTKHVVKMLVVVVLAFFVCWAPFHVQRLLTTYAPPSSSVTLLLIYNSITNISGVLYFISTCINPFLYNIMSHKFREAFKDTIASYLYRRSSGQQQHLGRFSRTLSVKSTSCNSHSATTCSSSHSLRYLEADLARLHVSKRPLVVSFKRIPPKNRPTSCTDDFTLSSCNYCNALHTADHHQQHPRMTYDQPRTPVCGSSTNDQRTDEPSSPYEKYHLRKSNNNNNNKIRLPKIFGNNSNVKIPKSSSSTLNGNYCLNAQCKHQSIEKLCKHEIEKQKHLLSQILETKPKIYYCEHKQLDENCQRYSNNKTLLKSISHCHNKTDKDVTDMFCSFYDTPLRPHYNAIDVDNNGKDSNLGDKKIEKSNIVISYCNLEMLGEHQQNMFKKQPPLANKCENNNITNNNNLLKINLNMFSTDIPGNDDVLNNKSCLTVNDESFERKALAFESFFRTKPLEKYGLEKTFSGKLNQIKDESLHKSKSLPCF